MERKEGKISLGITICIFIIILLVCVVIGTVYYYNQQTKLLNNKNVTEIDEAKEENKIQLDKENENNEKNPDNNSNEVEVESNNIYSNIYNALLKNLEEDNKALEKSVNSIEIYTNNVEKEKEIPEEFRGKDIIYGKYRMAQKYKKGEVPTLAGPDHKEIEIEQDNYVWQIFDLYFAYNTKTGDLESSVAFDMYL